jgi:hypothetical protein
MYLRTVGVQKMQSPMISCLYAMDCPCSLCPYGILYTW